MYNTHIHIQRHFPVNPISFTFITQIYFGNKNVEFSHIYGELKQAENLIHGF